MMPAEIIPHILHQQRGVYRENRLAFFDYMTANPIHGCFNIGYVRDIPHIQLQDGGFPPSKIASVFKIHHAKIRKLDAFVTMTELLAKQIKNSYNIDIPHALFQNFPSWQPSPLEKRNEFVYLGAKPIKSDMHESYLKSIEERTQIKVLWKYYTRVNGLRGYIANYDYASKYGLSVNATNFNQAREALNRKVLIYLMCGMFPVIHESFESIISFLRDNGISPLVFSSPIDIAEKIPTHEFGTIDRKSFCIENRIPELLSKIRGML